MVWVAKRRPPPGLSRIWPAISSWPRAQPTTESPGCVSSFLGRRTSMRNLFSAKRGERLAGQPVHGPFGVGLRAQSLVEGNRLAVPVEHRPLEPAAFPLHGQAGELFEERAPDAATALLRDHEQVLEIDSRLREEGREVVKEKGKAHRSAACQVIVLRDQGLRVVVWPEQVGGEPVLRHGDLVLQLFEMRQPTDQLRDHRNVGALARPDDHRHWGRSRSRKTNRIAPWVSEKLAILLSTSPAARPASMTSVSRISERPPFGRTTQIAPFGSIHFLTSFSRFKSRSSLAPMNTRSLGVRERPWAMLDVRSRSRCSNAGSSRSTIATFEPGLTPSLSSSGRVDATSGLSSALPWPRRRERRRRRSRRQASPHMLRRWRGR